MTIPIALSWRVISALCAILLGIYFLYQLGFSTDFQLDDENNIHGVSAIKDMKSALFYVFGGVAGDAGRPLSLLSFALQKDSWPDAPADFFRVNTLIHLLNGVVMFSLSYLIAQNWAKRIAHPAWYALAITVLWLALPLHVSASLAAVQRMTTLASLFMLLGMLGYVWGRAKLNTNPARAYVWMSVSLVLGTLLAVLSKENGVLLPLYVLVLEVFLLSLAAPVQEPYFKRWMWLFLGAPILVVGAYFAYKWPAWMSSYAAREFTVAERLMTESRILWEYLGHILMPSRSGTGLYRDDYVLSKSIFELNVLLAIVGWLALLLFAWLVRKRYPVVLFALLWFWTAHVIESTFIPLELYFEHRNYLAAFGPLLALCTVLWTLQPKLTQIARGLLLLLITLNLFVLSQVTHVWGQPFLAATIWAEEHPQSLRAIQSLAFMHFQAGDYVAVRKVILDGYALNKTNVVLALQSLDLSCAGASKSEFLAQLKKVEDILPIGSSATPGVDSLSSMVDIKKEGKCPHLSFEHLQKLADLLLTNKQAYANTNTRAVLHGVKYKLYVAQGERALAYQELLTAFTIKRGLLIALTAGRFAADEGQHDEAIAFLESALLYAPSHPVIKWQWQQEIGLLLEQIKEQRANALKSRG